MFAGFVIRYGATFLPGFCGEIITTRDALVRHRRDALVVSVEHKSWLLAVLTILLWGNFILLKNANFANKLDVCRSLLFFLSRNQKLQLTNKV